MGYTKDDLSRLGLVEISPGIYERKSILKESGALSSAVPLMTQGTGLIISFPIDPMGKPRMTQQDRWKKRPATDRYWEMKSRIKQIAEGAKFVLPESNMHMIFYIPMADSWSKKRKEEMDGKPHQQKPDGDNILKGIQDALCKDDSYVWDVRITKRWAYKGRIDIYNI